MKGNGKVYFYGRQSIDEEDIQLVCSSLRSDFISQGPRLIEFEEKVAEYCGARFCLAVSTGTAALHLASMALGIKKGDIGWTCALSFVASANCIRYCGGDVDFVDIDLGTFNTDLENLEERFEEAHKKNRLPNVIIPVHFAGQSCDMRRIKEIADKYGCRIIEDACQAMGGEYENKKIGCCKYSDVTAFSLHPVKSITTGEGGLMLTNDKGIYEKAKAMRAQGVFRGDLVTNKSIGPWHAEMETDGYEYKITEFQCALGISQLGKLDGFIEKRTRLAQRYKERLKEIPVHFQKSLHAASAWHLFVIIIDFEKVKKTKLDIYNELRERKINLAVHYYPIHLHSFYKRLGFRAGMFPKAEEYHRKAFSLPLHHGLELDDIDYICDQLCDVIN